MKTEVLIQCYESAPDMRITGCNISTGMKAHFHVNGKNQGYKIYMTNTGKSCWFYIKRSGKNVALINYSDVGVSSVHRLLQLTNWYI
jgi:hypothetical protein